MLKILFYGYGNPGRQDDALGISFIEEIKNWVEQEKIENISFDTNYQLNIEDADTISDYDLVFFADASLEPLEDFTISKVEPSEAQIEFTMHASSPSFVLNICKSIYLKIPFAFLVHIKGYEWDLDFDKKLSENGEKNLQRALESVKQKLTLILEIDNKKISEKILEDIILH
ncbi:MAG: hydrogenase maturation protease [Candidatus Cloacimonetes bacterium]|nr:hydrogenase maturation protease [Candidatus Cloacimonadota bacterium]